MLVIEASNAQHKQSHHADTDNQHDHRNRIIIEPMATLFTHAIMHSWPFNLGYTNKACNKAIVGAVTAT